MNDAQLRILFVFTDLILPLVLGYYLHQRSIISDRLCNRLISFNIIWICTLLSLLSFWVLPLTAELLWLPAFSFIFAAIPGIISVCTFARRHKEPLDRGAYIISSLLANIGTLGGLCAFILYGETGFAYAQLVVTFQNLILMLGCFPLAQYYYALHTASTARTHLHLDIKGLFISWNQLSVLGMLAGMLLQAADVPRPETIRLSADSTAGTGGCEAGWLLSAGSANSMMTVKQEPCPGLLWTSMEPCIMVMRFLVMDRPSPVPPNWRAVLALSCSKGWKRCCR